MEYAIEIKDLVKRYDDFSLNHINFVVPKGAVTGIIGENGAGKTTTIKLILNMIKRDDGEIKVFGLDNKKYEQEIKEKIGIVFGSNESFNALKIKDLNIVMKNIYSTWNEEKFFRLLDDFNINLKKKTKDFSTGMKQKLSICIALAHNPDLLILDEATNGLDPVVRNEMLDIIFNFIENEDKTVFFSSHITSDLEKICDYIVYIKNGEIFLFDEKDKILEEYALAKGESEELSKIDEKYIISKRDTKYSYTLLIKAEDKDEFLKEYPNVTLDKVSLEDIMIFNR